MAIKTISYHQKSFDISYFLVDNQRNKNIVFLHGWGSNKDLMSLAFSGYFKDFNHLYIDLPGFGRSPNDQILTTQDYANIIKNFFDVYKITPDVIVGHSFGGKVAILLDSEVILLSSAGILEKKPLSVKIKILMAKILKKLHIKTTLFRSKDADNLNPSMYETFKNVVNEDFEEKFKIFSKKATIFWGIDDKATSLDSGEKISKLIQNSRFYALDGDHYFFLKQGKEVEKLYYEGI